MNGDGLRIEGLSVAYRTDRGLLQVLRDVNLEIEPGQTVGLVGESGSGKSTLAYAMLRYLSPNARVLGGTVHFDGENLLGASETRLEELRGGPISMVYQDPATALNPTLRLGEQLSEGLRRHENLSRRAAETRGRELLDMVHLPDPAFIMRRFPHEVSGGEKQRVLIAMAFARRPHLMVFDEPTTALDATTSAGILDLIRTLQAETRVAVLYITHDLGIVAQVAQRISVIYAGQIVEEGLVEEVLHGPRHPYTRMLVVSVPNPYSELARRRLVTFPGLPPDLHAPPPGCIFHERCPFVAERCRKNRVVLPDHGAHRAACVRIPEIAYEPLPASGRDLADTVRRGAERLLHARDIHVRYGQQRLLERLWGRAPELVHAVSGIDLQVGVRETVGLVGESGCGKSTLARTLVGLIPFAGSIELGERQVHAVEEMTRDYRREVQIVFQHPDLSLNPRMKVGEIVGRPLRLYESTSGSALSERVSKLLAQVRLPGDYAHRHTHELSGGEKQRVAIARAFGPRPQLVVCDEITSGLDVSVQASILNLLADLQEEYGTAYVFISHDLNVVQHIADRVVVMYLGHIMEQREITGAQLMPPFHPYTEALLSAVPVPEPGIEARRVRLSGALPSPKDPPAGCPFHTRCPRKLGPVCVQRRPALREVASGHRLACHIPDDELATVLPIWHRRGEVTAGSRR